MEDKQQPKQNHPVFAAQEEATRGEMGAYLHAVGIGLNCRFDVPVLNINDVKWAAVHFADLAESLRHLAYTDERDEIVRVLASRYVMMQLRDKLRKKIPRAPHTSERKSILNMKRRKTTGGMP